MDAIQMFEDAITEAPDADISPPALAPVEEISRRLVNAFIANRCAVPASTNPINEEFN
jgi:hypothetical protein